MDMEIKKDQFGFGQQEIIKRALEDFMGQLCQVAPQLGGHLLSGGTIQILTMSGANLKLGFGPQQGGIILPGGIRPAGPVGGGFGKL